jgi:large repetitive protein
VGSGNPYGPPDAPVVKGSQASRGDKTVSWTWNTPANNGRAIQYYQINYDGNGWQNVSAGTHSYSRSVANYSVTKTLRVRAFTVVVGPAGSDTSTSGAAPEQDKVSVTASSVNSCTEATGGQNGRTGYSAGPPKSCYGVASGGGTAAPFPWLHTGNDVPVDRCGNPFGGSGWYHISGGAYADRWVRADTVRVVSGNVRC